ncbi:FAD-binding oxidoreductase [Sphingomonas ginkgonis]|uniref:FAD-binding oxidoreductase n=1 Tax=Sphingomonas ginkgonis TaxID=2315330 RepID=A0A429V987_9SPHN|nr:FAD-dependent oxidoreductase [Sphingomonas ginkgonis]RST30506.1 FAD-binding oxidoreductase [Sphingomonas ginkgonis]
MDRFDVVIVGAGIAGASLAARLAGRCSVLLLETEDQPGYHTSGRSAAFWQASYGGAAILPLTLASRAPLAAGWPLAEEETGWLRRRGALHLVGAGDETAELVAVLRLADPDWHEVDRARLEAVAPGIAPRFERALAEPSTTDIDTGGLLAACLATVRRRAGRIETRAQLRSARRDGEGWRVETASGSLAAGTIVNAAGAWGDAVARCCGVAPVGLSPRRRTVVQLRLARTALRDLPLLIHEGAEGFYVKGEADNRVWVSPLDETADEPCDAAAHEEDVAIAIDRFERALGWPIEAVERKWAGLRTFSGPGWPAPMVGPDPAHPGFAWAVGLGGWGFQTAPALSAIAAAALLREPLPPLPANGRPADYLFRRS